MPVKRDPLVKVAMAVAWEIVLCSMGELAVVANVVLTGEIYKCY